MRILWEADSGTVVAGAEAMVEGLVVRVVRRGFWSGVDWLGEGGGKGWWDVCLLLCRTWLGW